jgi:hypothetical protein
LVDTNDDDDDDDNDEPDDFSELEVEREGKREVEFRARTRDSNGRTELKFKFRLKSDIQFEILYKQRGASNRTENRFRAAITDFVYYTPDSTPGNPFLPFNI